MKIKPILFSAPMVRALLEGRKTQTRRVLKFAKEDVGAPEFTDYAIAIEPRDVPKGFQIFYNDVFDPESDEPIDRWRYYDDIAAPYAVGDVLWVRETWANTVNVNQMYPWPDRPHIVTDSDDGSVFSAYIYRADGDWHWCDGDGFSAKKSYWKPSIFMPKAACRLFLKVKSVRAERLQEISEADAIAEGIERVKPDGVISFKSYTKQWSSNAVFPYSSFMTLWQSINGPESWAANPWVWVVEFEKCDKPENF
jgi:hypothetical protein